MKILVYGAGVIGSIYAGRLALSGQDVTVLARGKRFDELVSNGIILNNVKKNKVETVKINVINILLPDEIYDYIFVVMQRNQVDAILSILAKNKSKNIVFVVNTSEGYEKWVEVIGKERIIIGFPSAGGERANGKVNYFIGKGAMRVFQTTTFGEYNGLYSKRIQDIIRVFNKSNIPTVFCRNMDAWQKTHVAMVTSIGNALYKYNCNNYELAKSYLDVKMMVLGMKEGIRVLNKLNIKVTPNKLSFIYLPTWLLTIIFKLFMGTKFAEITTAKHCIAAKDEMIYLQHEFDKLIDLSNVKTPNINVLRQNLH